MELAQRGARRQFSEMSRGRKLGLLAFVAATALGLYWFFKATGPTYQGRSVAEWFEVYDRIQNQGNYDRQRKIPPDERKPTDPDKFARADMAFVKFGTNAIPFLVGRMLADSGYSSLESWRIRMNPKLPGFLKWLAPIPKYRGFEATTAANLISTRIDAPAEMLLPFLQPLLNGTNTNSRILALGALQAISSSHNLVRPYLEQCLKDPDPGIQGGAINLIRFYDSQRGDPGTWAIDELLALAASPKVGVYTPAVLTLTSFGTRARPVLPQLEEMLARETVPNRRNSFSNAIHVLSQSKP